MKKILRCLVVVIFFMFISTVCYAKEPSKDKKIKSKSVTVVNPMYNSSKTKNYYDDYYDNYVYYGEATDLYELKYKIKEAMEKREESIEIYLNNYEGNYDNLDLYDIDGLIKEALDEDHYLKYSLKSYNVGIEDYYSYFIIKLKADYLTNIYEEKYVDLMVDAILYAIITDDMNDYMKEKAIHDYIVANVAYDESLVRHSAYDAIADGTTVCQGYALLMYKMLEKVGIESIIVESRPMQHVWNMVYIDGNWYHVDATWDDPVPDDPGVVNYDYYNLSDYEMESGENGEAHIWDKTKYPTAEISYDYSLEKDLTYKKEDATNTKIDISTENALLLNIKLNKNVPIKKVELFDGDKFLFESYEVEDNLVFMPYKGELSDKTYKIKVTVEDGRSCFTDIKIIPTVEVEEVDNENKVVKIKALINGEAHMGKKVQSVKKGDIITIKKDSSMDEKKVFITPNIHENELYYNALKIK